MATNKTFSFTSIEDIITQLEPEMINNFIEDFRFFLTQMMMVKAVSDDKELDVKFDQPMMWLDDGIIECKLHFMGDSEENMIFVGTPNNSKTVNK